MQKTFKKLRKYLKKLKTKAGLIMLLFTMSGFLTPCLSLAQGLVTIQEKLPAIKKEIEVIQNQILPKIDVREPNMAIKIWLTAYTSHIAQTDSTPCITASGLNLCERNTEDIIATNFNFLPFGTKIKFPELFGDQVFIVQDRMNRRYTQTADIWMKDYKTALAFGRKLTAMEILPSVVE